jgi:hypothetical protein
MLIGDEVRERIILLDISQEEAVAMVMKELGPRYEGWDREDGEWAEGKGGGEEGGEEDEEEGGEEDEEERGEDDEDDDEEDDEERGEEDEDEEARRIGYHELVAQLYIVLQRALQSGPLLRSKPADFKRCKRPAEVGKTALELLLAAQPKRLSEADEDVQSDSASNTAGSRSGADGCVCWSEKQTQRLRKWTHAAVTAASRVYERESV